MRWPRMRSEQQASGLALARADAGAVGRGVVAAGDRVRFRCARLGTCRRWPGPWAAVPEDHLLRRGFSAITLELGVLTAAAAVLFALGIAGFRIE
ncbi:MAG: hypothetical protein R2851_04845 [Caldilineaceae bacterium]